MTPTFQDLARGQANRAHPDRAFYRGILAMATGKGNARRAVDHVREHWDGFEPELIAYFERAAVDPGTTGNSPSVVFPGSRHALASIMADTALGRMTQIRRVPFEEGAALFTGGSVYGWIGEGAPHPVGRLTSAQVSLPSRKVGGIVVVSDELARSTAPAVAEVARREIRDGLVAFHDATLLSDDAAVPGVSPAGLLNGVAGDVASGANEAALRADLRTLLGGFTRLDGVCVIMSEANAMAAATSLPGGGGVFEGRLFGLFPLIVTAAATDRLIAVREPDVLLADDGGIALDVARNASLILDDDPGGVLQNTGDPPVHTSLWQHNLVGLKITRWLNWQARAGAVRVITGAAYI